MSAYRPLHAVDVVGTVALLATIILLGFVVARVRPLWFAPSLFLGSGPGRRGGVGAIEHTRARGVPHAGDHRRPCSTG